MEKLHIGYVVIRSDFVKVFASILSELFYILSISACKVFNGCCDLRILEDFFLLLLPGFHNRAEYDPFLPVNTFNEHIPQFCGHFFHGACRGLVF